MVFTFHFNAFLRHAFNLCGGALQDEVVCKHGDRNRHVKPKVATVVNKEVGALSLFEPGNNVHGQESPGLHGIVLILLSHSLTDNQAHHDCSLYIGKSELVRNYKMNGGEKKGKHHKEDPADVLAK